MNMCINETCHEKVPFRKAAWALPAYAPRVVSPIVVGGEQQARLFPAAPPLRERAAFLGAGPSIWSPLEREDQGKEEC